MKEASSQAEIIVALTILAVPFSFPNYLETLRNIFLHLPIFIIHLLMLLSVLYYGRFLPSPYITTQFLLFPTASCSVEIQGKELGIYKAVQGGWNWSWNLIIVFLDIWEGVFHTIFHGISGFHAVFIRILYLVLVQALAVVSMTDSSVTQKSGNKSRIKSAAQRNIKGTHHERMGTLKYSYEWGSQSAQLVRAQCS